MPRRETAILALLLARGGAPVAWSGIGTTVYGPDFSEARNSLEGRIGRIRRSFRQACAGITIEIVRGF